MEEQSDITRAGATAKQRKRKREDLSRRGFVKRLGGIGAGTLTLAAGTSPEAKAQYGHSYVDELTTEQLVGMYKSMLEIRHWESKVKDLLLAGGFRGVAHLYVGQEACAVGVCRALRPDDYITSNHRGHGHLIAKGGDLGRMLAEITHKATGYCKGYGGSLHITDLSLGILGMNGIVGAGHLLAAGAAYGIKVKGTDQVAVSFGGDGSIQGSFFTSAANSAATWKLPWIAVIENNGYEIWVKASDVYGITDLARRAEGYGIEGRVIDGNDVLAVYNATRHAVKKARAGGGPTVIECKTYRWYDHYGSGGARVGVDGAFGLGYRSDRELRGWMAKDPIPRFRKFLVNEKVLTEQHADEIKADVLESIEKAVAFAAKQPPPRPEDGLLNVFAQGAVPLRNT
jgi:TPP-dependent pyruvate/acetoin dehydrogenase alpha subunit